MWIITISGAEGTIYAGEKFRLRVAFPEDYPTKPPAVYFLQSPPPPKHQVSPQPRACFKAIDDPCSRKGNPAGSFAGASMVTCYKTDELFHHVTPLYSYPYESSILFRLLQKQDISVTLYRLMGDVCVCSPSHQRGVSGWKQGALEQGGKFTRMFVVIMADPRPEGPMFSRAAHCWERSTITRPCTSYIVLWCRELGPENFAYT